MSEQEIVLGAREAAERLVIYLRPGDVAAAIVAGQAAKAVIEVYQRAMGGIGIDGEPGPQTRARAEALLGGSQYWPADVLARWPDVKPAQPSVLLPMSAGELALQFGSPHWTWTPTDAEPERVTLDPAWVAANIAPLTIPELDEHFGKHVFVQLNRKVHQQWLDFFAAFAQRGYMPLIRSFDGSFISRFKRQLGTLEQRHAKCEVFAEEKLSSRLSRHALGTAIDMNAGDWPLGKACPPASEWRQVRPVMNEFGIASGMDFHVPDAMHGEVGRLLS